MKALQANPLKITASVQIFLARGGCEEPESAFIIYCIFEVQPACLGAMKRLLASCHSPMYSLLGLCCTCAAPSNLQLHPDAILASLHVRCLMLQCQHLRAALDIVHGFFVQLTKTTILQASTSALQLASGADTYQLNSNC